jgi:DNA-binding transcriptional LysR family regulator
MDLRRVDLNLLVVFEALMAQRSVGRAAQRLGLSQPATSAALARLRQLLGDPLLLRHGNAMQPTLRAERLLPAVRQALRLVEDAFAPRDTFDPTESTRRFRLVMSDYAEHLVLPQLVRLVLAKAPGVTLRVKPVDLRTLAESLADGTVDAAIGTWYDPPKPLRVARLLTERFVCALAADHPIVRGRLTLAQYVALPHLLVAPRGGESGLVDDELAERRLVRHIAVTTPDFAAVPRILAGTPLVATIASLVALRLADPGALQVLRPPLALPGYDLQFIWDAARDRDPGLLWLRRHVEAIARELATSSSSAEGSPPYAARRDQRRAGG